ncbi:MAG: hypothetical protein ABF271_07975 [Abyssibacter sp.]|uniref:hypothetical protein n=1 Tax=Abyssibacter sp. TaxID=2320200 RepID=UPI00321B7C04
MITFITPTALPIEAATTMGVSAKEGDKPIGKFGTGLKYAIAGILRLNGTISIVVDGETFDFTAVSAMIRGREFLIVHCNDLPCGFTTELGKHWKPWQLFRELASNALDESGSWTTDEVASDFDRTVMRVSCEEVERAAKSENVFLPEKRQLLLDSSMGAKVYAGRSEHYYFRGIRAGSFDHPAPVTIDVTDGELSEDRLLDLSRVTSELGWAFSSATRWDESFLRSVVSQRESHEFWVQHIQSHYLSIQGLPQEILCHLAERRKAVAHPVFKSAVDAHIKKSNGERWAAVPMTERHKELIRSGEAICLAVDVDPIPSEKVRFTKDLPDGTLAVTVMDTREVWFSTQLVMLGRDEFLAGYLEEALHAMTGARDETRQFQNNLLAIVIAMASREVLRSAA